MKKKIVTGICALAALTLLDCGHKEKTGAVSMRDAHPSSLASAKTIEDVFPEASEVRLELTPDSALASISDLAVDAKGNFLIADGVRLNQVLVFGPDGKFLRQLGTKGQGPGEYMTPLSLAVSRTGEILINDYLAAKILFYDMDYRHERDLKALRGHYVRVGGGNAIYLYEGMLPPAAARRGAFDTIKQMDESGGLVRSFAPLQEELLKNPFSRMQNGMDIDKDGLVYEMNPVLYQVRKYSSSGELLKSFTNPNVRYRVEKDEAPPLLNGPFCLDNGFVLVQRGKALDIFDGEGNLIVGGIAAALPIACVRGRAVYFVAWDEEARRTQQSNPLIICRR